MVRVVLKKFGEISEKIENEITAFIEKCYDRLRPHKVELLDLLLFRNPSEMKRFYTHERGLIGVASEDFDEEFFAMHDAWRGTSRIAVCIDRMKILPKLIQVGALRHEVGHSVLHGSLEYYVFPLNPSLIEASEQFRLSREYIFNLLYLISITVKDFEVTKLLCEKGYVEDQFAYSKHVLTTSREDLATWEIVKDNAAGTALYLAGRLKDVSCYIASQEGVDEVKVIEAISRELSYLPKPALDRMLKVIKRFHTSMVDNTFQNVDLVLKVFIEDALTPLFN